MLLLLMLLMLLLLLVSRRPLWLLLRVSVLEVALRIPHPRIDLHILPRGAVSPKLAVDLVRAVEERHEGASY